MRNGKWKKKKRTKKKQRFTHSHKFENLKNGCVTEEMKKKKIVNEMTEHEQWHVCLFGNLKMKKMAMSYRMIH